MPVMLVGALAWLKGRWPVVLALVAVFGIALWWLVGTRQAVVQRRVDATIAAGSVKQLQRVRVADEKADVARADDGARILEERKERDDAVAGLPDRPLSDRQRARLECVRGQQAARLRGEPVPACGGPGGRGGAGSAGSGSGRGDLRGVE